LAMTAQHEAIIAELYKAVEPLGSWGDTLSDDEVLEAPGTGAATHSLKCNAKGLRATARDGKLRPVARCGDAS
jgi:hypothetical protein